MMIKTNKRKPPPSTDADSWLAIVSAKQLNQFTAEEIIAAFQDAGGRDRHLRELMAGYLSDMVYRTLRRRVGRNRPNEGNDIIDTVHGSFFAANCDTTCADARGYRTAFASRLMFRLKDALSAEQQAAVIKAGRRTQPNDGSPLGALVRVPEVNQVDSDALFVREELSGDGVQRPDPGILAGVDTMIEDIDVKRIVAQVIDPRKRLAFQLHMDLVPIGGKAALTIARTLGVDRKTVEHWIEEVREFLLTQVPEVQTMQRRTAGE